MWFENSPLICGDTCVQTIFQKLQNLAIGFWLLAIGFVVQCEMWSRATAKQWWRRASHLAEMPRVPKITEIGKPSTHKG
jgi:hypothetical protein